MVDNRQVMLLYGYLLDCLQICESFGCGYWATGIAFVIVLQVIIHMNVACEHSCTVVSTVYTIKYAYYKMANRPLQLQVSSTSLIIHWSATTLKQVM